MSHASIGFLSAFVAPAAAARRLGREKGDMRAGFSRHLRFPTSLSRLARLFRGRRAIRVLASWDDAMLSDIGLTRADIERAHDQPLTADPTRCLESWVSERRSASHQLRREAVDSLARDTARKTRRTRFD